MEKTEEAYYVLIWEKIQGILLDTEEHVEWYYLY